MTELTDPPAEPDDPHTARLEAASEQEALAWTEALGAEYRIHLERQCAFLVRQVSYLQGRGVRLAAEVARRDERISELEGERATQEADADPEKTDPWD